MHPNIALVALPSHGGGTASFLPLQRTAVLNVVGLSSRHIGDHTPKIRAFMERNQLARTRPILPAVTCTAQATYMTGGLPQDHGAVANGWYDREYGEHRFWKQSENLVAGEKLWELLRKVDPSFTCAKVFWWYNMFSTADYTVTPRPLYLSDGRKVFDIHTQPMKMRDKLKRDLGDFPFPSFWGPRAGLPSTQWIAESARWIEDKHWPSLSLVYLPHLDYNQQRLGVRGDVTVQDLQEIDEVVGGLITFYEKRGVKVVLLSEYGITDVERPVHLNRLFRQKGWLSVKDEVGTETIDYPTSRAFAIADHQVAHIYVQDPSILDAVREAVEETEGVGEVLVGANRHYSGLEHERSGELIAVADARSWFTYYYWMDDKLAPDFARCVDIHRKCGYDPAELFLDPAISNPKLKVAGKLAKKALGFRMTMDLIPLDASLVRGSHGRIPEDDADWPLLVGDFPDLPQSRKIAATDVFSYLYEHCSRGEGYEAASVL